MLIIIRLEVTEEKQLMSIRNLLIGKLLETRTHTFIIVNSQIFKKKYKSYTNPENISMFHDENNKSIKSI